MRWVGGVKSAGAPAKEPVAAGRGRGGATAGPDCVKAAGGTAAANGCWVAPATRGAGTNGPVPAGDGGISDSAAPIAMAFFGSVSTATGRPSWSETSCATSGIRDEPPTSSTAVSCSGVSPAEPTARRRAETVSSTWGRIIASNSLRCRRTDPWPAGVSTGMETSVSDDSASFASVHSRRTDATAESTAGSVSSSPSNASGRPSRTCSKTSSSRSMPPRRSTPSGRPIRPNPAVSMPAPPALRAVSLWTTAASNVPPPKS